MSLASSSCSDGTGKEEKEEALTNWRIVLDEKGGDESSNCDDNVEFGFAGGNRGQLLVHWFSAVLIGVSLRMTTFPEAMIEADLGVDHYLQETSFLVSFGVTKALSNLLVGWVSDRYGRKAPNAVGWALGVILGIILLSATHTTTRSTDGALCSSCWMRYVVANIFLGAQQGMTWTTNIFMFLDILGPRHRALASGISNSTGYLASALATYAAALVAPKQAFGAVLITTALGLVLSLLCMKDTKQFVAQEEDTMEVLPVPTESMDNNHNESGDSGKEAVVTVAKSPPPSFGTIFANTCWRNKSTALVCLSGLITNLVTSLAWGLVMIWGKQQQSLTNIRLAQIASAFTVAKAASQIIMSQLSDRVFRRKAVLVFGFAVTAVGLVVTAGAGLVPHSSIVDSSLDASNSSGDDDGRADDPDASGNSDGLIYVFLLVGGIIIGFGIGSVYCVMTGAISDHTPALQRASAIGIYKLWRDSGYAVGGLLTGLVADLSGGSFVSTTLVVAGLVVLLVVLLLFGYREAPSHVVISMVSDTARRKRTKSDGGPSRSDNKNPLVQELQTLRSNQFV